MTQPVGYTVTTDFSDEAATQVAGRATVRPDKLDAELAAIATTLTQLLANLAILQRDDTGLRDQIVAPYSLSTACLALIGSGSRWTPRGAWLTLTLYTQYDMIEQTGASYLCLTTHTSGTFATDYAAGKWMIIGPATTTLPIAADGSTNLVITPVSGELIVTGTALAEVLIKSAGANNAVLGMSNVTTGSLFALTAYNAGIVAYNTVVAGGRHEFYTNGGASTNFKIASTGATDVNYVQVTSNATGSVPSVRSAGGDSNIALNVSGKGTGSVNLYTNNMGSLEVEIAHVASAVNRIVLAGSATGDNLPILAAGTDTNIGFTLTAKGGGNFTFKGNGGTQLIISPIASADRYITISGGNGSNALLGVSSGNLTITCPVEVSGAYVRIAAGTAVPAGGTAGMGVQISSTANLGVFVGSGAPTLAAAKGSLYLRTDGSAVNNRAYINTDAGTTWTALTTAA